MSKIKIQVIGEAGGFIYGSLRTEGTVVTLKPIEHSKLKDNNGKPIIISAEQQFSPRWMEKLGDETPNDEYKEPSEMKVGELREALESAGIDIPNGTQKPELIELLENHLTNPED